MFRLGCHLSIGDGLEQVAIKAQELGCNAVQIFSRSPRGGKAKELKEDQLARFRQLIAEKDINPLVVHMPYFINLASSDEAMWRTGIALVAQDLARADLLGAQYFVLHTGSHRGEGTETGIKKIAQALNIIKSEHNFKTTILLENMAGSGSEVGVTFEELREIFSALNNLEQTGVCLDTCHAFAAGYDWTTQEKTRGNLQKFEDIIGLKYLKIIHANDSMHPLNSKKDRHANIGKGFIGVQGFQNLIQEPSLKEIPFILETPHERIVEDIQIIKDMANLTPENFPSIN